VTVLRTFLRFLQAAVEVAAALVVEAALAVVDVTAPGLSRHLHDFVIWSALTPGMAERVRGIKPHHVQ